MGSNTISPENTRKIASYKLKIDQLINTMNKDNIAEHQRDISILKHKIKALEGRNDQSIDWGVRLAEGTKI